MMYVWCQYFKLFSHKKNLYRYNLTVIRHNVNTETSFEFIV